ncbi:MAG: aromatic ring-hydroxylating dioxygenase subunit alpha [Planctomycetota bacterium]
MNQHRPTGRVRAPALAPLATARTLPARCYFDRGVYERELCLVFGRTWQCVGRTDQVRSPGDYFTASVGGEPIVVVRGKDRVLRAFVNVCRHRAGDPVRGHGCADRFQCHYHGWTYALDGRLIGAPEMAGTADFDPRAVALTPVRVETWAPLVFVNLDGNAPPLLATLGDLPARARAHRLESLEFADRVEYTIACNWKAYIDNFLEGYHIPRAHPGLNRVLDYKRYTVEAHGNYVLQYGPNRKPPAREADALIAFKQRARPRRDLAGSAALGSSYYWVFPAFMWNLSPDVAQANMIVPLDVERTLTIFEFYYPQDQRVSKATRQRNIAYSDAIQQEDIVICESVQRNLHSRSYESGRYCAGRENGLYHFHRLLRETDGLSA